MIAAWMLYSVATGLLLFAGATAADRVGRSLGVATRFVWFAAIIAAVTLVTLSIVRKPVPETISVDTGAAAIVRSGTTSGLRHAVASSAPVVASRATALATLERRTRDVIEAVRAMPLAQLDRPLAIAAGASAAVAFLALIVALLRLRRFEEQLERKRIGGHPVLISPGIGPALVGVLEPRIVLPRWALALESNDLRLILEHERRHAQAHDPLLLFVSTLLTALQPWNPALWLLRARTRLAIETDCDRRVLTANPDVRRYAELLLTVNQHTGRLAPSLAFAERPSNIERRIHAMLEPRTVRPTRPLTIAAASAIILLLAAWKLPTPTANAAMLLPSTTSTSSITGGGPCVDGTRDAVTEMNELARVARQRHPAAMSGRTPLDSVVGFVIDETCAIRRDTSIALRSAHWNQDSLFQAAFPDVHRTPGQGFGVASFPTERRGRKPTSPSLFYLVQPTNAWTTRRANDACGFGTRADERCSESGSVAIRRLDSMRIIIAVRAHHVFDDKAPFVDHYFLVSSLRPLPANLTRQIPFARVTYQNNSIEIENRITTDPYLVFGPSLPPPRRSDNPAHAPPPPRITIDSLMGIAHYLQPAIKLEDVGHIRPAKTCDGPVGACYEVNGKKIEFPG